MRNMIAILLIIGVLSLIAISPGETAAKGEILKSYQGNLSEKTLRNISMYQVVGPVAETIADTVKFEAPRPNWNLKNVTIYGWDGYSGTSDTIPTRGLMVLEVRDKNLDLLYKFSDIQTPYTSYIFNISSVLFPLLIDLPEIPVSDEFYICFYDRGVVSVGFEFNNSTNSYFYDYRARMLVPAKLPTGANNTTPVQWLMTVGGS